MFHPPLTSSIVLAGKWNPYILTPVWIGKNIFDEPEIKAEILFGPENITKAFNDKAQIIPSIAKVIIVSSNTDDTHLKYIENVGRRLVELLPHTPISAIGFNIEVIENNPSEDLVNIFDLPDTSKLRELYPINYNEIKRQLNVGKYKINIIFSEKNDSDSIKIRFNFHYDVTEGLLPSDILKKDIILEHYSFVKKLTSSKYQLEYDEIDTTETEITQ